MADRSPAVARTNCDACGGPVSEAVLVCPHCGEKRAAAPASYTKAEIQALIDNDEAYRAHTGSTALFKALLLPHKHTRGIVRILELALTAITLPAVLVGAIAIALLGSRRSQGAFSTTGELAPTVVMTILGGASIWVWLGSEYALIAVTAMWARAGLRMITAGQAERAQIDAELRPAKPALPAARAVTAPTRPSAPVRPSTPVVRPVEPPREPPRTELPKPGESGDEPSILR
jgi:hypothetical protein